MGLAGVAILSLSDKLAGSSCFFLLQLAYNFPPPAAVG